MGRVSPRSPSGCGPAARAALGTCRTSRGRAATGGCPPGSPRTRSAVCPSTPVAPSLRVRRYASWSQAISMWWASVVSAMPGASLASFAIRSSLVETVLELGVSVIFPSNGSVIRRRSLLGGVPRVGSPASSLVLRRSDFPAAPASLACALLGGSAARCRGERRDLPGSWGTLHGMPCSMTPVGPSRRAIRALPYSLAPRCCLPLAHDVGIHDFDISGLESHGLHARCLRFAAAVTDVHARLASGWWPTLAGRDSNPPGRSSGLRSRVGFTWLPPDRDLRGAPPSREAARRRNLVEKNSLGVFAAWRLSFLALEGRARRTQSDCLRRPTMADTAGR